MQAQGEGSPCAKDRGKHVRSRVEWKEPAAVVCDYASPLRRQGTAGSNGAGLAGLPPLTPNTPSSDFQTFVETLLSPLTPLQESSTQNREPTSRDWASYQIHSPTLCSLDFANSRKCPEDPFYSYSPAHAPNSCQIALGNVDSLMPIDYNSQAQLISNAQALAARLKGKTEKPEDVFSSSKRHSAEATVAEIGRETPIINQRKRKRALAGRPSVSSADSEGLKSLGITVPLDDSAGDTPGSDGKDEIDDIYIQGSVEVLQSGARANLLQSTPSDSAKDICVSNRTPQPAARPSGPFFATGESPMSMRMTDAPNISPAISLLGNRTVSCNCKKSKCLKLYCDCFRAQKYCDGCNCQQCANGPEHESERQRSMLSITERNPEAFLPRITSDSPTKHGQHVGDLPNGTVSPPYAVQYHFSGCHCKKSACLKKYCECFQAQVPCQARCRCQDCKNSVADGLFVECSPIAGNVKRNAYNLEKIAQGMHSNLPVATCARGLAGNRNDTISVNLHQQSGLTQVCDEKRQLLGQRPDSLIIRDGAQIPGPLAAAVTSISKSSNDSSQAACDLEDRTSLFLNPSQEECISSLSSNVTTLSPDLMECSTITLDVLSTILAAQLRKSGILSVEGNISPEDCIKEGLLLLQRRGITISHQGSNGLLTKIPLAANRNEESLQKM